MAVEKLYYVDFLIQGDLISNDHLKWLVTEVTPKNVKAYFFPTNQISNFAHKSDFLIPQFKIYRAGKRLSREKIRNLLK